MVVTVLCPLRGLRTAPAESCRGRHTLCLVMRPVSQLRCLRSETGSTPVRGARRMPRGVHRFNSNCLRHDRALWRVQLHLEAGRPAVGGNEPLRTLVAVHRLQSHGDQPSLQNSERGFDSLATCGIVVQRENAWPAPRRCEFESRRFHRPGCPRKGTGKRSRSVKSRARDRNCTERSEVQ